MVITDDHSKAKFVFPLKRKSDAVTEFKKWLVWAERMSDRRLKCVRSDNAKELTEGGMKALFNELGIETEVTLPYEHEQNGMAERANRTLEEKARCLLMDAGLEQKYWADALRAAAFLANRSPAKGEKVVPIESFSGIKPDLSGVRVFGSICYAKRPVKDTSGSSKFEARGERCRFIGYAQGEHSYVVIREHDGEEMVSTHVIFHENEDPGNGKKEEKRQNATPQTHELPDTVRETLPASAPPDEVKATKPAPKQKQHVQNEAPVAKRKEREAIFEWKVDSDLSSSESSGDGSHESEGDEDSGNEDGGSEQEGEDGSGAEEGAPSDEGAAESSSSHSDSGDDFEEVEETPPRAPRRSSRTRQPPKRFWETAKQKIPIGDRLRESLQPDPPEIPGTSQRFQESITQTGGRVGTWRSPPQRSRGSLRAPHPGNDDVPGNNDDDDSSEEHDLFAGAVFLTVDEAMGSDDWKHWQAAMDKEIKTLEDFGTWKLVDLPEGRKTIGCKWHLTRKVNADGTPGEYKARLVAKGYSQIEGVDYFETFAPVARIQSIRIILALANEMDLEVDQIDIKAAYLNGWMDEEIYMIQPPGYVNKRAARKACLLIRGLYGTKQAGNIWNKSLDGTMTRSGYRRLRSDRCVYMIGSMKDPSTMVIVIVYVDDILVIGHSSALALRRKIIEALKSEYSVKEMGQVSRYLGILVNRNRKEGVMVLSQRDFAIAVLERFNMKECLPVETPMMRRGDVEPRREEEKRTNKPYRSLVGSLMYLNMCTRPDIAYAVGVLSRFLEDPAERHWEMGVRVLRYLKGTVDYGLEFQKGQESCLRGYADSDWVSDKATGRSTRGFVLFLGTNVVNWKSKRHRSVATSTTSAETDALYHGLLDEKWTRDFLEEVGTRVTISEWFCDNQAAVAIVNSSKNVDRVRHELVKIQYIRERIDSKLATVEYISTKEMVADALTKQLGREEFKAFREDLGLVLYSRSEKWGSVGNDLSDREPTQANVVSLDAPEREESNGLSLDENGEELMLLGAYCVGGISTALGVWREGEQQHVPTVTINGPGVEDDKEDYSDWFRAVCGQRSEEISMLRRESGMRETGIRQPMETNQGELGRFGRRMHVGQKANSASYKREEGEFSC
jgi:hypothetical protein